MQLSRSLVIQMTDLIEPFDQDSGDHESKERDVVRLAFWLHDFSPSFLLNVHAPRHRSAIGA